MKQVIQNYQTGDLALADVPTPCADDSSIVVRNISSLISVGTERSIIDLGKKSLLGKARARPDLVKRFVDKAKKEGLLNTYREALGRLDNPTALGYSSAGVVVEAGQMVSAFLPGDRVACVGAGYASHAEYIRVPEKLCAKIPVYGDGEQIGFEEAAFGMLGIIALHGVRCARLEFGETVAVMGLGLLGLLTAQILRAYGCRVIGTDLDPSKLELAAGVGITAIDTKSFVQECDLYSGGLGVDAVVATVATKSDEAINTAVEISRFGGRIVLVGVADIHPDRNEMWHKEVEIIVSKAGGPGSLDPVYENKGVDYPYGYVRWTEKRNLEEFLRLLAERRIDVRSLVSHRFPLGQAETVYDNMVSGRGGPYVGVLLDYESAGISRVDERLYLKQRSIPLRKATDLPGRQGDLGIGVIGAGLFGKALLLPALRRVAGVRLRMLSTSSSVNSHHTGMKYGFEECTTDYRKVLSDGLVDAVIILTPHRLHAQMTCEAMAAGKHVFVEKPLCVNDAELSEIMQMESARRSPASGLRYLMVGYNRRFSPHASRISGELAKRKDPMVILYRVNAGYVPPDHWVQQEEEGGGRIVGEVCHFVDLMMFLTGASPERVHAERISGNNRTAINNDNVVINMRFTDGSVGSIAYSGSGDKAYSREHIEVFVEGKTIVCTDFRRTSFHQGGRKRVFKTSGQSMGYREELMHFSSVVGGKVAPLLSAEDLFISTASVFAIQRSLVLGKPVTVSLPDIR